MPVRRDDRIDVDDGAQSGSRAGSPEQAVQQCPAGIGHLLGVIEARRFAVVDPLQGHARDIGSQDLLGQWMALRNDREVVGPIERRRLVFDPRLHDNGGSGRHNAKDSRLLCHNSMFTEISFMAVVIGVLKETVANETRVAVVPEIATKLKALGARVILERGAGIAAHFPDAAYPDAEFGDASTILKSAQVLLKVQPPSIAEVNALNEGALVVGFMQAYARPDLVRALTDHRITSFSMELVPRISRAQSMDALSSQASVAGYKAVLIAANALEKFLPMLTTAAGTIRPASVLVIGAGVAGLQAIATARRLGAVVEAYDVRSATKDQVKSLGAKFVETGVSAEGTGGYARELTAEEKLKQQEVLDARIAASDAVISTASVPGRAAPRIIGRAAVERMH